MQEDLDISRLSQRYRREWERRHRARLAGLVFLVALVAFLAGMLVSERSAAATELRPETVSRLASGIARWKLAGANGHWYACGVADEDVEAISARWAEEIFNQASSAGLNPWAVTGVVANESRFDECAIGIRSRRWAYQAGLLTPSRRTISHTREDVLAVLHDPRWKAEIGKAAVGPMQIMVGTVWRTDPAPLLTITLGVRYGVEEMVRRSRRIGEFDARSVAQPWATWPGYYSEDYAERVRRYARALGAGEGDL